MGHPEAVVTGVQLTIAIDPTAHAAFAAREAALEALARVHPDGTPATWVVPWGVSEEYPAGTPIPGWRCPACGFVEPSRYLLTVQHGDAASLLRPEMRSGAAACWRQELRASQAAACSPRRAVDEETARALRIFDEAGPGADRAAAVRFLSAERDRIRAAMNNQG